MNKVLYAIQLDAHKEFFWNEIEGAYTETSFTTWKTERDAIEVLHAIYTNEDAIGHVVELHISTVKVL